MNKKLLQRIHTVGYHITEEQSSKLNFSHKKTDLDMEGLVKLLGSVILLYSVTDLLSN